MKNTTFTFTGFVESKQHLAMIDSHYTDFCNRLISAIKKDGLPIGIRSDIDTVEHNQADISIDPNFNSNELMLACTRSAEIRFDMIDKNGNVLNDFSNALENARVFRNYFTKLIDKVWKSIYGENTIYEWSAHYINEDVIDIFNTDDGYDYVQCVINIPYLEYLDEHNMKYFERDCKHDKEYAASGTISIECITTRLDVA